MRSVIAFLVLCFALVGIPTAQEKAVLSTPAVTTVTEYQVTGLAFTRAPRWYLNITYTDNTGKVQNDIHLTPSTDESQVDAQTLIVQLNKANLSTKSLERRLMEHLISEGKIPAATITGVPQ